MASPKRLDAFKEVHKGLRNALFQLSLRAGSADENNPVEIDALEKNALEVFRFLDHHALNEDRYLIPDMRSKKMAEANALSEDHGNLERDVQGLRETAGRIKTGAASLHAFYLALNRFIAKYLRHMDEEEGQIQSALHAAFTDAELGEFPRKSVAGTAPADQGMMLAHMFPAMNASELREFFDRIRGKAPREMWNHLLEIAGKALGDRIGSIGLEATLP